MRTLKITGNQMRHVVRLLTKYSEKHGKEQSVKDAIGVVVASLNFDASVVSTTIPTTETVA